MSTIFEVICVVMVVAEARVLVVIVVDVFVVVVVVVVVVATVVFEVVNTFHSLWNGDIDLKVMTAKKTLLHLLFFGAKPSDQTTPNQRLKIFPLNHLRLGYSLSSGMLSILTFKIKSLSVYK